MLLASGARTVWCNDWGKVWKTRVRFPATTYVPAHPASYPVGTAWRTAGAWRWPFTSVLCRSWRMLSAVSSLSCTSLWLRAWLSPRTALLVTVWTLVWLESPTKNSASFHQRIQYLVLILGTSGHVWAGALPPWPLHPSIMLCAERGWEVRFFLWLGKNWGRSAQFDFWDEFYFSAALRLVKKINALCGGNVRHRPSVCDLSGCPAEVSGARLILEVLVDLTCARHIRS